MKTLHRSRPSRKPVARPAAVSWPAWTDVDAWTLGSDPLSPLESARALGRSDAERGLRRDPGHETSAECLAYACARNRRLRELAELLIGEMPSPEPDHDAAAPSLADLDWAARHDDSEGLTEREAERLAVEMFTDSALDVLLGSIDDRADEAAAQDRLERGVCLA
jgi:hypothetical protein